MREWLKEIEIATNPHFSLDLWYERWNDVDVRSKAPHEPYLQENSPFPSEPYIKNLDGALVAALSSTVIGSSTG